MFSVPTSKAHNSLIREVLLLLPFYRWRNRGPEWFSDLHKVTTSELQMKTQFQLTLEPALVAHMRCSLIAGGSRGSALTPVEVPSLASQLEALSALNLLPGALTCPKSHPGAFSWNMSCLSSTRSPSWGRGQLWEQQSHSAKCLH